MPEEISYIDRQIAALSENEKREILMRRIVDRFDRATNTIGFDSRGIETLHVGISSDREELKKRLTRIVQAANEILTCCADAELLENAK